MRLLTLRSLGPAEPVGASASILAGGGMASSPTRRAQHWPSAGWER
ncbi:MAG: hypothetical protein AAF937_10445 [Planctomycetota bacterium]